MGKILFSIANSLLNDLVLALIIYYYQEIFVYLS